MKVKTGRKVERYDINMCYVIIMILIMEGLQSQKIRTLISLVKEIGHEHISLEIPVFVPSISSKLLQNRRLLRPSEF